ncbi:Hypothetical protein OINT_2000463 [Brucella intermedia LMG 3301]|uniref:Uncharacterized protein n=1 Tax=Brucella intermedia LMG 3301 TaxID=641118 RepID=C4WN09_9HYPH|nr:Hypothetical protein OINT_2000463 [Brucella intermedia LMG 3301]
MPHTPFRSGANTKGDISCLSQKTILGGTGKIAPAGAAAGLQ